jgi:signal transduction histidine kinase
MAELLQDVAQKFDLMAETRDIRLLLELPTNLPLVYADLSMMERVVTNLLDNAVRHTPNGGKIYLRARQQDDQLMVEVEDNGSGVPGALRATLFQRPSVLDKASAGESRGLGLMIVGCCSCTVAISGWWMRNRGVFPLYAAVSGSVRA